MGSILEKIKLFFINRYLQSFIRTAGLWIGTLLAAAGVDPDLAGRYTQDTVSILSLLLPYLLVQALSWLNAKKS